MKGHKKRVGRGSQPLELRRRAVRLYLEEGVPLNLVAKEIGVHKSTIYAWAQRYKSKGEAGIQPRGRRAGGKARLPPAVKAKIVEVKEQHPGFGVKRIAQWMKRVLFLPSSPETVRRTLHQKKLILPRKKKAPRNAVKPRFFERSTPNQLWQSDIFMFRLGGKNAYLIGFIDDYSRYLVGLDLFRSQTAEHVLEVYRTSVAEYGVPKEMLTDQGRQYANWRGKTRFQLELQKDRVHHLMSRPHHPMTLGKIERFWKTIWEEFLVRAQFGSFEEARERVRWWVKYYNHKRPHQSMEGHCPADRFFQIQQEMRKVIEAGIRENVQELALRGEPKEPFYMVGRMGGQSVVLSVEKGQFRMQVDGEEREQNVTYPKKGADDEREGSRQEQGSGYAKATPDRETGVQCAGEGRSGAGVVDGEAAADGGLSGSRDQHDAADELAGAGSGGIAGGAGAADTGGGGSGSPIGAEAGEAAGGEDRGGRIGASAAGAAADPGAERPSESVSGQQRVIEIAPALFDGDARIPAQAIERADYEPTTGRTRASGAGATEGGVDHPGEKRGDHGNGSSGPDGCIAQDLLPVGATRLGGADRIAAGTGGGPAGEAAGRGEGGAAPAGAAVAGEAPRLGADDADPRGVEQP
jgi:transposase InsO family protein